MKDLNLGDVVRLKDGRVVMVVDMKEVRGEYYVFLKDEDNRLLKAKAGIPFRILVKKINKAINGDYKPYEVSSYDRVLNKELEELSFSKRGLATSTEEERLDLVLSLLKVDYDNLDYSKKIATIREIYETKKNELTREQKFNAEVVIYRDKVRKELNQMSIDRNI